MTPTPPQEQTEDMELYGDECPGERGHTRAPKFGEWMRGVWASSENPIRDGMFVRSIRRTGRFSPGLWYELTDGNGRFWQYTADGTVFLPCASMQAQASDKAKGPGCATEAIEAGQEPPTHAASVAALQREVEELRADALRYRWLRDRAPGEINFDHTLDESNGGHHFALYVPFDGREIPDDETSAATLDESIDAAMASKAEVPNG